MRLFRMMSERGARTKETFITDGLHADCTVNHDIPLAKQLLNNLETAHVKRVKQFIFMPLSWQTFSEIAACAASLACSASAALADSSALK